jgi:hypothetical protein
VLRVRLEVRLEEALQASNRRRVHQVRSRRRVAERQLGRTVVEKESVVEEMSS